MAKRTKKLNKRSSLKLEALESRQLLAGVTGSGTEVTPGGTGMQGDTEHYIQHPNGNKYDQVLMTGSSVAVTNDAGQVTRVSFLDLQGDIVQAEFSGAGTLTITLDNATTNVSPDKYIQSGVKYVQGLASFTVEGSNSSTNLTVFSVGSSTAVNQSLFDTDHKGGDHTADVARITIVADTANPNGSAFGGVRAGNAVFSADSGPVGISAANVQVQSKVIIGDINATGSATPTLVFGKNSQFGDVEVAGGGLVSANGKAIFNTDSYAFGLTLKAGTKSDGTADAAETTQSQLSFTGNNPVAAQTKVFDLTGGVDTITGTTGNDTINGTQATITGLDSINGNTGTDSFVVNDTVGTAGGGANLSLASVSNVEKLAVNSVGGLFGNTLDVSKWSGLTDATITLNAGAGQTVTAAKTTSLSVINQSAQTVDIIGGGGALVVQNGAAAVTVGGTNVNNNYSSASVKGGSTVAITDHSKADDATAVGSTLTSVTLDGNTGAAMLTSKGLTSLTLKNLAASTTVTNATDDHSLSVTVDKVTGGTITDATADGVTITSMGDSSGITVTAVDATALTLDSTAAKLTLADVNVTKVKTITINGGKDATISATTDVAALTSINASGATGKVTIGANLGTGVAYTGGSGADSIKVQATTKAITTGAGDDTVEVTVSALGTDGSIDAGDGADTLKMTLANAVTASATNTFEGTITGFDRLDLGNINSANAEVKLNNLDDINYITVGTLADATNTVADTITLSGLTSGVTLKLTGAAAEAANDGYAIALADNSGSSDVANVILSNAAATNFGKLDASGIETVNITTDDTTDPTDGDVMTLALTDAQAKTINVSGDGGLTLTGTGVKLTSFDASGVTKGAVTLQTAALDGASTLKGGAGNDSINASAATKAVTIWGGAGNDTLTGSTAQANTIDGGDGADTIVGGSGADTLTGGAGDDTITTGGGLDTVTGGAGKDTFIISPVANGNSYATITDLAAGDKLQFADQGTETFSTTKISLAGTAAFQDYLDAAAASTSAGANGNYAWFQYGGDTYVVQDNDNAPTFQNGTDVVVKITGTSLDLSKATGGTTNVLTIV